MPAISAGLIMNLFVHVAEGGAELQTLNDFFSGTMFPFPPDHRSSIRSDNTHQRSPKASDSVLVIGLNRNFSTVLLPVLISVVVSMPG